jgi:hypothetical protein
MCRSLETMVREARAEVAVELSAAFPSGSSELTIEAETRFPE